MALYSVSLRQSWDPAGITRRKWSNVFFVDAPSSVAAAAAGVGLWTGFLRNASRSVVFCYEVYATSVQTLDDDYTVQTVPEAQQRGALPNGTGEFYAPRNCISVTIRATAGRPSRKFWRPGLFENDVVAGQAVGVQVTQPIEDAFNAALGGGSWLDPDGQVLLSDVVTRFTSRSFGRESTENLPTPPPQG